MEEKYISVYCKTHINSSKNSETISNILQTAKRVYERLISSYADDNVKIMVFGLERLDKAYSYLPKDKIEAYECKNIKDMCKIIWNNIKDSMFESRVYIVLANWQWRYIEPLLRLKDDKYRFFYEGVQDSRSNEEIELEKRYEKVCDIKVRNSLLRLFDEIGKNISTDLKG